MRYNEGIPGAHQRLQVREGRVSITEDRERSDVRKSRKYDVPEAK